MTSGQDRLKLALSASGEAGSKSLICFVTAGDPSLEGLPAILDALTAGGATVIEVGLPYSDPIADGPTIQSSSQRALDRGVTLGRILEVLEQGKGRGWAPIVLMGYWNNVLAGGADAMAQKFAAAGVCGSLLSDLPPAEADEWVAASQAAGLANIFLLAPTSTPERQDEVARVASGFVYVVSRTGVTGGALALDERVPSLIAAIREKTGLPVVVGFGLSRPEDVATVCAVADGAVIGSFLVQMLAEGASPGDLQSAVLNLKSAANPH